MQCTAAIGVIYTAQENKHLQPYANVFLAAYCLRVKIFIVIFHSARFPLFLSGNIFNIPL
jgi:hypothetical protein